MFTLKWTLIYYIFSIILFAASLPEYAAHATVFLIPAKSPHAYIFESEVW